MICSHPDSTLDILKAAGLVSGGSSELNEAGLVKPEGLGEGDAIPEDQDPRLAKIVELSPENGRRLEGPWGLSDDGLDAYFKVCYLIVLTKYKAADCLEEGPYQELVAWVEQDGFLNAKGEEYLSVLNALKAVHSAESP